MYDNIRLVNRLTFKGKLKKKNISIFGKSLSFILNCLFALSIIVFVGYYCLTNFNNITLSSLLNSIMNSSFLQLNLLTIFLLGFIAKFNWKGNHSIAINTTDEDIIRIIFNEGKYMGMEYRILMEDISNICLYKDGAFSFYCAEIEVDKGDKLSVTKGVINIKGGDSGIFIEDLQDYLGKNVQYKNKRN